MTQPQPEDAPVVPPSDASEAPIPQAQPSESPVAQPLPSDEPVFSPSEAPVSLKRPSGAPVALELPSRGPVDVPESPTIGPTSKPSIEPFAALSEAPHGTPTFLPTPVPVIDVVIQNSLGFEDVPELPEEEVTKCVAIMTDWFAEYYGIVRDPSSNRLFLRRRQLRRRDSRDITFNIQFAEQEQSLTDSGLPVNFFTYNHRLMYEDPPGPVEDIDFLEIEVEESKNGENGRDIDDMTPEEIAIAPFKDFQYLYKLGEKLKESIPSFKEVGLPLPLPETKSSEQKIANVNKHDKPGGSSGGEDGLSSIAVSSVIVAAGFVAFGSILVAVHMKTGHLRIK